MVDELWRYLVAEAREAHGVGQTSANKATAKGQSKPQQQSAPPNVPQGAGDVPKDAAKKVDPQPKAKAKAKARAKSKGAGKWEEVREEERQGGRRRGLQGRQPFGERCWKTPSLHLL